MAEAVVSALVSTILGNLNSLVFEEIKLVFGLKSEFEKLKRTFIIVQAVLKDAEEKQWKDEAIRIWLTDLKDAAYDADDVLDEFAIEAERRRQQRDLKNRVRSCFSLCQNPLVFREKMARKLKNVSEKLDAIAYEKKKFKLTEGAGETEAGSFDWRVTSSVLNESEIYGRDKEKQEVISMLLANSDDLFVYAICGMGGLGKTTLAKLVYNDGSVKRHFDLRIWVCVSDDFDIRRLSRAIIESIEGNPCSIQELDTLQRRLQEKLIGRRFLLVLDDIWDHYHDRWNGLKDVLRVGARGSAITLTTRIMPVALRMATVPILQIGRLSEADSWLLFERLAFGIRRREEYVHLETMGKAIANKCGGVPLALKALGSLMRSKRNEQEWLSVQESEIWNLGDEGSTILPALKLSYNNLPPHLKQCFAFCCLFPKDYVMKKDRVVELWMANGFICPKGRMDLHEMGYEMFDDLVGRSFFEEIKESGLGDITCKMHDLVHDLAQSVMIQECCLIEENRRPRIAKTVRHTTLVERNHAFYDKDLLKLQSLRSLISINVDGYPREWSDALCVYLSAQKHLRALNLSHFMFTKLPKPIANLKHLRYLDISHSFIQKLPESTSSLHKLQTLNLSDCSLLTVLPKRMKEMKNLMYLDLTGCDALRCMPARMGQLTRLRKLSIFLVGEDDGHSIRELQRLNLGGRLSIKDLDNVKNSTDAKSANLMRKTNLHSLSLSWREDSNNNVSEENSKDVLCALEPHSNTKKLEISGYGGSKFPDWMMELRLPNLVKMGLESCVNCEHLPPFGKLQFLKNLEMKKMDTVKCIGSDMYGDEENPFPSLERLSLGSLMNLEGWATDTIGGRAIFTALRSLSIEKCPKLVDLPIISSVKTLIIKDCVTVLRSAMNFTFITRLEIEGFDELTVLPDRLLQNHTRLLFLSISEMRSLKSLSNLLDNLSSLKYLRLCDCDKLESLPEGVQNLNSLEVIHIVDMPKITALCGLPSTLEDLWLSSCPKLNSLPESIQHLTSLRCLTILFCEGLSCLPNEIQHLTSLSRLLICGCYNLMSLPEGIRNLDMLKELEIRLCPNLERRCNKERGEDWLKIAHIPTIIINDQLIQSLET